jgi:hypothetical protein
MFGIKKRKMEKQIMSMLPSLSITSKVSLKQFCLLATKCDVSEAQKLYDFLIKDMEDLPVSEPVKPTVMQNVKQTANDVFGFIKENQDGIAQGVDFIKALVSKRNAAAAPTPTELPPIN